MGIIKSKPQQMTSIAKKNYYISYDDIIAACPVMKLYTHYTPLLTCKTIDQLCQRNIYFKCENFQKTGSFKFRGSINALHKIVQGKEEAKPECVVACSSGNYGQALAESARMFGISSYIVTPPDAPECKKNAIRGYGGTVVECKRLCLNILEEAKEVCKEKNGVMVSLSVTPEVMAGQGTLAVEMLEQNPDLDVIIAPVGSGGMISGIAVAAKHLKPSIRVYAAEPERANDCYLSKLKGELVRLPEISDTIADGLKYATHAYCWPIIRDLVDDVITVTEDEIKFATKLIWERAKLVIETSSGVGVAAVLSEKFSTARNNSDELRNVGVVLCGGNMDLSMVAEVFKEN